MSAAERVRDSRRSIGQKRRDVFPPAAVPRPASAVPAGNNDTAPRTEIVAGPPSKKIRGDEPVCGWCNKLGHTVRSCAGPPGEDGTIAACALHNAAHCQSECHDARDQWDLGQKYWWLVASRANLPPLQYHERWENIAWEWTERMGGQCSEALPFTADFCRAIPNYRFAEYDYDCPSLKPLGYEKRTSSVAAFREWWANA
ncbi:hypothetical protein PG993_004021 [Apiospora rasikravindrae]|uniref:Uncharacterized protein n=1 Tax=Apiospora rasikravindrae TaxID=990691 RepID=A0ABR1TBJ6_9PEZI